MIMSTYKESPSLKLALAELAVSWEDKEENQKKCKAVAELASKQEADLLIFPEMTLTGFSMNTEKIAEEKENSPTLAFFKELSAQYKMAVAFGMAQAKLSEGAEAPICQKGNGRVRVHNVCYVLSRGEICLEYKKLHPFSFGQESEYYEGGDRLALTELHGMVLAPQICYDLRFPEPFQILSAKTDLIFVIANWPQVREGHWRTLLCARAIENQCYLAGINRCGEDPKGKYPQASLIYDPYGNVVPMEKEIVEYQKKEKRYFAGNLYLAEIRKQAVLSCRDEFPLKKDRREDLYQKLRIE